MLLMWLVLYIAGSDALLPFHALRLLFSPAPLSLEMRVVPTRASLNPGMCATAALSLHTPYAPTTLGDSPATAKENAIAVWEVAKRQQVAVLAGHTATIRDMCYSKGCGVLATTGFDKTVHFWGTAADVTS